MAVSSITVFAPYNGQRFPDPGILRPASEIDKTGGTGPFDVLHEWDTSTSYNTGNLIQVWTMGASFPDTKAPTSDLGPFGTNWFYRVTIFDTADQLNEVQNIAHDHTGGTFTLEFDGQGPTAAIDWNASAADVKAALEALSNITTVDVTENATGDWDVEFVDPGNKDLTMMSVAANNLTGGTTINVTEVTKGNDGGVTSTNRTLVFFDPRMSPRHHHLLVHATVGFSPTDDPDDWGVGIGGTEAPDGDVRLLARHHHLLVNAGVGFRFTDRPPDGTESEAWGVSLGGTWGDGDERLDNRFHYLLKNIDTTLPSPFLFHLAPVFGRPGDSFVIHGWALKPHKNWAEGLSIVGGPGGSTLTDGQLPHQNGSNPEVATFIDRGLANDDIRIDLTAPRLINEARVWYRRTDPFTSLEVFWSDSGTSGPWTSVGSGTPATLDPGGTGWATIENWSANTDFGSHRYWRFLFTAAQSIGELEVNRRMTIGTGDIEPRMDDSVQDWLLTISQQFYDQMVAQAPNSGEEGANVRVENVWPDPDLVSNTKHYTFLDPIPAKGVGVIVKVYDRDAPQQLIAIAGDADAVQFQQLLSGVGSAEFTVPLLAPAFREADFAQHYNVVRIYLDQVERWWGHVTWTGKTLVDDQGREREAIRFVARHGLGYLGRYTLIPANWPSVDDPVHQFVDATHGEILIDLIGRAQADGFLSRLVLTFTATHDSANDPWDDTINIEFQPGTGLIQVVGQLIALGMDVRMDSQFRLHAYNRLGFDRNTEADQPLFVGHAVQALSEVQDFQEPGNVALISYGDGQYLLYNDPVSQDEWDKWLKFAQTSAENATSAQRLAEVAVETSGQPQDKISIAVQRITDELEPFVDFDQGDVIRVVDKQKGFDQDYRVRGITVDAGDVRNPTFVLELNSLRLEKIIEHEILLNRQLQNTLPIEVASSEPGGSAPREHGHKFPSAGADVTGTVAAPVVTGWQGTPIDPGPFSDGDIWAFDQGSGSWVPLTPSEQGDILYWNGSDWVFVEGTKNEGWVPTIQADGSVEWAPAAGGGGGRDAFAFDGHANFSTTTTTVAMETPDMSLSGNYRIHGRTWIAQANPGSLILEVSTNSGGSWAEASLNPHAKTDTRGPVSGGWSGERHVECVYVASGTTRFRLRVASEGSTVSNTAAADTRFEHRIHVMPIG